MNSVVDRIVTHGVFALDGGQWDVDNNVWLVGDDREVLVVDAAHDAEAIATAIGDRRVTAIVCTHGHNDHIDAAVALRDRLDDGVPILIHPADRMLWDAEHPDTAPDGNLTDGQLLDVAGSRLQVIHTPGHTPGGVCLYAPGLGALFTGDTLFEGGPGATGRSYSDKDTLLASIRVRLLGLPGSTVVHTGHGPDTTIAAEAPGLRSA